MVYAHKSAKIVDEEAVQDLSDRLEVQHWACNFYHHTASKASLKQRVSFTFVAVQVSERNAPEQALLQLATLHWHLGALEKARSLVENALQLSTISDKAARVLLGWILISQSDEDLDLSELTADTNEALQYFDTVLFDDPTHLEVPPFTIHMPNNPRAQHPVQALDLSARCKSILQ